MREWEICEIKRELIIPSHYWKYKHNQVVLEQMKLILNKTEPLVFHCLLCSTSSLSSPRQAGFPKLHFLFDRIKY